MVVMLVYSTEGNCHPCPCDRWSIVLLPIHGSSTVLQVLSCSSSLQGKLSRHAKCSHLDSIMLDLMGKIGHIQYHVDIL